jgi:hypothetical protein
MPSQGSRTTPLPRRLTACPAYPAPRSRAASGTAARSSAAYWICPCRTRTTLQRTETRYFAPYLAQVETHNRIDPLTGTVVNDFFYAIEAASRLLGYTFVITPSPNAQAILGPEDLCLLYAGLLFTDRLGAKKNRGRGRCVLKPRTSDKTKTMPNDVERWIGQCLGETQTSLPEAE